EVARRQRGLVRAGRDRDGERDEIRILVEEIAPQLHRIVAVGQWRRRRKAECLAAGRGLQILVRLDANAGSKHAGMREAAVVDDRVVVVASAESRRDVGGCKGQKAGFAWEE